MSADIAGRAASTRTPQLFFDRGCPYAQRVLALFAHLGARLECHESNLGEVPEGIERYSASARLPLLVDGDLVLTESRVMLEHAAERHQLADAYPAELEARTLHRHAMAVVDGYVAGLLSRSDADLDPVRLDEALETVERATLASAPGPCLLRFHVAPLWLRFRWWHPSGAVTRAVQARPSLCSWLDDALLLDGIARTTPDRTMHMEDVARARELGLLPHNAAI